MHSSGGGEDTAGVGRGGCGGGEKRYIGVIVVERQSNVEGGYIFRC